MPQNIIGMECIDCKTILSEENTLPYHRKKGQRICRKCQNKRVIASQKRANILHPERREHKNQMNRKWIEKNRTKFNESVKKYMRKNCLYNKRLPIPKRERPDDVCEICHNKRKHLMYHHWDEEKPWLGVWCCISCHILAEAMDCIYFNSKKSKYFQNGMEEYKKLRQTIQSTDNVK